MVIYELLIIIVFLWIFSMVVTKDLFSPCSMICESYIIAVVCAIYNIENWAIDLHYNTLWIIVIGLLAFVGVSTIFELLKSKKDKKEVEKVEFIHINKNAILFFNTISLVIFLIYVICFYNAVGSFSSEALTRYRSKVHFGGEEYIPATISFFSKFCRALAYVNAYVLINNVLYIKQNKQKLKLSKFSNLIFGIILFIPLTLLSGGRFDLMVFLITMITMWNIIYMKKINKKFSISKIIKLVVLSIILLVIFSSARTLVGRTSESDFLDYITLYLGGSIEIFDIYLQEPHVPSEFFGQELFAGARKFLAQLHILDNNKPSSTAGIFRTAPTGVVVGNVYTGFRKMYQDFGFGGVIFFQIASAYICNKLYYTILYKKLNKKISMKILIYNTITFCLLLHSFSEFLFSTIISFNYIALFIFMYFIKCFIVKKNVDEGIG